ncbi:TPA: hypothetical protein QCX65_004460 [Bacillus mycoides]|uniref:hypothetical protein n=1 Tax=Bacillus mycoides TaxID=1405 RepID=UPI002E1DEAB9|nr:hypothetical protein [Bacillus mycoides]HDR7601019.1 hypothetical protein [Bacillus mycoides]
MFWLGCLIGCLIGTLVTVLVIYIGYRVGEMNRAEKNWHELTEIDKSVDKEMEQLKALRDDKG